ncbi:Fc.00g095880.m01.CDS01 [Cosmosporella sp. VM-42]
MVPKSMEMTSGPKYSFVGSQFVKAVYPPKDSSLAGQTVILTGGNVGLGFACADSLLQLKVARLIIAVRTPSKGEAAAEELRQKHKNANIEVWQVDMLSYKSVQAFAARCQTLDRIDIAILNAGTVDQKYKTGPEGHESMFQVNYLSTVLLATLLLPTLKAKAPVGKPGRLTIVNSGTSHMAKFPNVKQNPVLAYYDDKATFDAQIGYSSSKALAHFWIVKLVEWVKADDVVVNLVDPGLVKGTSLHRNTNGPIKAIFGIVKSLTGRTLESGVSTFIDAAVVRGKESHGSYIMDWKIYPYAPILYTPEGKVMTDRVWNETLSELKFANIDGILESMSK